MRSSTMGRRCAGRVPPRGTRGAARRAGRGPAVRGAGVAARAHAELEASGLHPRKMLVGGVEALTPSERRVAALAATGMANAEIAQNLSSRSRRSRPTSGAPIEARHPRAGRAGGRARDGASRLTATRCQVESGAPADARARPRDDRGQRCLPRSSPYVEVPAPGIAALAVLVALSSAVPASGANGRIAFVSDRHGNAEILTAAPATATSSGSTATPQTSRTRVLAGRLADRLRARPGHLGHERQWQRAGRRTGIEGSGEQSPAWSPDGTASCS